MGKYDNILTKKEVQNGFNGYYVYGHYKDRELIYIGKGCRSRAISNIGRKYKTKDLDKIVIFKRFEFEEDALKFEQELINKYKYDNNLLNKNNVGNRDRKMTRFEYILDESYKKMFKWRI